MDDGRAWHHSWRRSSQRLEEFACPCISGLGESSSLEKMDRAEIAAYHCSANSRDREPKARIFGKSFGRRCGVCSRPGEDNVARHLFALFARTPWPRDARRAGGG